MAGLEVALGESVQSQVKAAIREVERLRGVVDEETEPYKSKYAAADLLQEVSKKLLTVEEASLSEANVVQLQALRARVLCERGLFLLDTDLAAQGEAAVLEGISSSWPDNVEAHILKQRVHNALGALYCSRSEFDASQSHLGKAVEAYQSAVQHMHHQGQQPESSEGNEETPEASKEERAGGLGTVGSNSCQGWDVWGCGGGPKEQRPAAEAAYTTSLFFLAQVHGLAGHKEESATYCAATLNRELHSGEYELDSWVQNCLQLSGYFINCHAFALSEYCLAAVEALLASHGIHLEATAQQHQGHGTAAGEGQLTRGGAPQPSTGAVDTSRDDQQQQSSGEDGDEGRAPGSRGLSTDCAAASAQDQEQQPDQSEHNSTLTEQREEQGKGNADKQHQQQEQGQVRGALPQGTKEQHQQLSSDVAANVHLARGKQCLYRLVASLHALQGNPPDMKYSHPSSLPQVLRFDALPGLPEPSSLTTWGAAALVADYPGALVLARTALPAMRAALAYYQLDGWVTEHVNILFEMSNLYRILAAFEMDPHKRCVLHKNRTKLLLPLEGALSFSHYPGLVRSISLELANTFREVHEIKEAAGWPPAKVAAAGAAAAHHYQAFLDSFKESGRSQVGRVEDAELEEAYLGAAFNLGRLLHKSSCSSKEEMAILQRSLVHLEGVVGYVTEHKLTSWAQEAELAEELSRLLQEKMKMLQVMDAHTQAVAAGAACRK